MKAARDSGINNFYAINASIYERYYGISGENLKANYVLPYLNKGWKKHDDESWVHVVQGVNDIDGIDLSSDQAMQVKSHGLDASGVKGDVAMSSFDDRYKVLKLEKSKVPDWQRVLDISIINNWITENYDGDNVYRLNAIVLLRPAILPYIRTALKKKLMEYVVSNKSQFRRPPTERWQYNKEVLDFIRYVDGLEDGFFNVWDYRMILDFLLGLLATGYQMRGVVLYIEYFYKRLINVSEDLSDGQYLKSTYGQLWGIFTSSSKEKDSMWPGVREGSIRANRMIIYLIKRGLITQDKYINDIKQLKQYNEVTVEALWELALLDGSILTKNKELLLNVAKAGIVEQLRAEGVLDSYSRLILELAKIDREEVNNIIKYRLDHLEESDDKDSLLWFESLIKNGGGDLLEAFSDRLDSILMLGLQKGFKDRLIELIDTAAVYSPDLIKKTMQHINGSEELKEYFVLSRFLTGDEKSDISIDVLRHHLLLGFRQYKYEQNREYKFLKQLRLVLYEHPEVMDKEMIEILLILIDVESFLIPKDVEDVIGLILAKRKDLAGPIIERAFFYVRSEISNPDVVNAVKEKVLEILPEAPDKILALIDQQIRQEPRNFRWHHRNVTGDLELIAIKAPQSLIKWKELLYYISFEAKVSDSIKYSVMKIIH